MQYVEAGRHFAKYVDSNAFGEVPVEQRVKNKRRHDKHNAASIN
jgi:hypothetical protein